MWKKNIFTGLSLATCDLNQNNCSKQEQKCDLKRNKYQLDFAGYFNHNRAARQELFSRYETRIVKTLGFLIEVGILFSCAQASNSVSFDSLKFTHVVNQLPDHSVPLSFVILRSVLPISHQPDFVREAQDVGELFEKIKAVTLETIVPHQLLVRLFIHHIGIFLSGKKQNKTKRKLPLPESISKSNERLGAGQIFSPVWWWQ